MPAYAITEEPNQCPGSGYWPGDDQVFTAITDDQYGVCPVCRDLLKITRAGIRPHAEPYRLVLHPADPLQAGQFLPPVHPQSLLSASASAFQLLARRDKRGTLVARWWGGPGHQLFTGQLDPIVRAQIGEILWWCEIYTRLIDGVELVPATQAAALQPLGQGAS